MGLNLDEINKLKNNIKASIDDGSIQGKVKKLAEDGVKKGVDGINGGINSLNNYMKTSNEKKGQSGKCPYCNAPLNLNINKDSIRCPYCDSAIDLRANKSVTDKVFSFVNQQQEKEEKRREEEKMRREEERRLKAIEDAKPFYKKKQFIGFAGLIVFLIIDFIILGVMTNKSAKKSAENEAKLEVLLQEVNEDINNGDFDSAEIKANMLKEDSGYSSSVEKKWDDTRKSVLKLIDEKKTDIAEQEAKEKAEKEAKEKAEKELAEKKAKEKAEKEKAEQETKSSDSNKTETVTNSNNEAVKWDFCYAIKNGEYSVYYLFDKDSGEVVNFTTNDTYALKGSFTGDKGKNIKIKFSDGGDTWNESFDDLTWFDHNGLAYDGFVSAPVSEAVKQLEKTNY